MGMRTTRPGRGAALAWMMLAVMLFASAAGAAGDKPEPKFMRHLFAPDLVMKERRAIDLDEDQRKAITRAIQKTQSETVELGWSMQDAATDLESEITKETIDEKAALAAAERVMSIEGQVKRAHLALLIQIRNALRPDQRERLRKIRDEGD